MAKKAKDRIKVALDPSTIIDLFTLIHPKHDKDGQIMKALQEGTLRPEDWQDVAFEDKPKLLQDKALGHISHGRFYRLENVYSLLQLVLNRDVEIYITPSTFFRLTGLNDMEMDFMEEYVTNLTIAKKDAIDIYGNIYDLATEYIKAEKILNPSYPTFERSRYKAYVVAEASLCGLPVITSDMTLIHTSRSGYEVTEMIKGVNRQFSQVKLGVRARSGNIITPTTMSLASFLKSLETKRYYLYPMNKELRVSEEDNIITHG